MSSATYSRESSRDSRSRDTDTDNSGRKSSSDAEGESESEVSSGSRGDGSGSRGDGVNNDDGVDDRSSTTGSEDSRQDYGEGGAEREENITSRPSSSNKSSANCTQSSEGQLESKSDADEAEESCGTSENDQTADDHGSEVAERRPSSSAGNSDSGNSSEDSSDATGRHESSSRSGSSQSERNDGSLPFTGRDEPRSTRRSSTDREYSLRDATNRMDDMNDQSGRESEEEEEVEPEDDSMDGSGRDETRARMQNTYGRTNASDVSNDTSNSEVDDDSRDRINSDVNVLREIASTSKTQGRAYKLKENAEGQYVPGDRNENRDHHNVIQEGEAAAIKIQRGERKRQIRRARRVQHDDTGESAIFNSREHEVSAKKIQREVRRHQAEEKRNKEMQRQQKLTTSARNNGIRQNATASRIRHDETTERGDHATRQHESAAMKIQYQVRKNQGKRKRNRDVQLRNNLATSTQHKRKSQIGCATRVRQRNVEEGIDCSTRQHEVAAKKIQRKVRQHQAKEKRNKGTQRQDMLATSVRNQGIRQSKTAERVRHVDTTERAHDTDRQHEAAATKIQHEVRKHQAKRRLNKGVHSQHKLPTSGRGVRQKESPPLDQKQPARNNIKHFKSTGEETLPGKVSKGGGKTELSSTSLSPSRLLEQSGSWMSPGKAAASAAAAAAKEAARAAAASVRAAEAAADAADAAEAAADAEVETLQQSPAGGTFRSPPASFECRVCHSPARSAFWPTEGDKEGLGSLKGRGSPQRYGHPAKENESTNRGQEARERSPGDSDCQELKVGRVEEDDRVGNKDKDRWGSEGGEHVGGDEEMLKKARYQARRHARDRRARALAKEEQSKRELQVVQAELAKAEELRERQAMAEKSALEAKRARVLEDMKRRQQRLRRLQEEEGLLSKTGDSHPSTPSRPSSADEGSTEGYNRRRARRDIRGSEDSGREAEDAVGSLSLPPLARVAGGGGEGGGARARRKPRHVSSFRERILEERRVRKEVDTLKRKEVEQKCSRQVQYAAKIRAQAKRALAAEQRRAQEDVDRSARRIGQSSVDRTPIAIKKAKRDGEWGVFSYAPDRPAIGAAARRDKRSVSVGRPPATGFGSTEKVQERLGSSELVERMRKERLRATEASRARAAATLANEGGSDGKYGRSRHEDGEDHRVNEAKRTMYTPRRLDDAGHEEGNQRGNGMGRAQRPCPPKHQRGGASRAGGSRANSSWNPRSDGDDTRGRIGGDGREVARHRDLRNRSPLSDRNNRPAAPAADAAKNVHAMYEERLAALERRLAAGDAESHHPRHAAPAATSGVGTSDVKAEDRRERGREAGGGHSQEVGDRSFRRPPPRAGRNAEWGAESNPFGYRKLSAEEEGTGSVSLFGRGGGGEAALRWGGSEASGGEDVEGLSTMYMGPIAHKMAELRAGHG